MQIIISPAKKMTFDKECPYTLTKPALIYKSQQLLDHLKKLEFQELKELLKCNDQIATLNLERFQSMDLARHGAQAAILSYDGIQYQYMAPGVFDKSQYRYLADHLWILSGFYGALRPFDGIQAYRLEMQTKLKTEFCKDLYDFWDSSIYKLVTNSDHHILNLASKEYSRVVEKYATPNDQIVRCVFGSLENGKVREKGVYVKMARGEMVRFLASENIQDFEGVKNFDGLGFRFSKEYSDELTYVFLKEESKC